jgi:hypothetical protein
MSTVDDSPPHSINSPSFGDYTCYHQFNMAPATTDKGKGPAVTTTYSTAGTVSSPLDLDNVKGEHQSVNVSGGRRKVVSPKVKVTLTSLTVNNVSAWTSISVVSAVLDGSELTISLGH